MVLFPVWLIFSLLALSGADSDSDSDSDSSGSGERHRHHNSRYNGYPPASTYPQGYPSNIYNHPAYPFPSGPPMYGSWYPPPAVGYGYPMSQQPLGYPGYGNPQPPSYGPPQGYGQNMPTYPAQQQPSNGGNGGQHPPSNGYYPSLGPMYYPLPQTPATSQSSSDSNTTVINN